MATGATQKHLSFSFRLGHSTVGIILNEVTEALWQCLGPEVLQPPSKHLWLKVAEGFKQQWNFPNCIGTLQVKGLCYCVSRMEQVGVTFFNTNLMLVIVMRYRYDLQFSNLRNDEECSYSIN